MVAGTVQCIYCGSTVDPAAGEGDHIIPAGLGEFRNDRRFRRICQSCNNRLSKAEQQFLQCGPESFFRAVVNPATPRSRNRGGRSWRGAASGVPTPQFMVDCGDHYELVQPTRDNPRMGKSVDQLVVKDETGKHHMIKLFPGLTAESLKKRIDHLGIEKIESAWMHGDQSHFPEYHTLFMTLYPKSKMEERAPTPAGVHAANGCIKITVNNDYFRVIAKLGFHHYLVHSRRGIRGDEPQFSGIRKFIMEGGNRDDYFANSRRWFALPFGELEAGGIVSPKQWCHVLAFNERSGVAVGYVNMFLGPGCVREPYYITFGKLDSKIIVPAGVCGHVYFYDELQAEKGYAGHVEVLDVSPLG